MDYYWLKIADSGKEFPILDSSLPEEFKATTLRSVLHMPFRERGGENLGVRFGGVAGVWGIYGNGCSIRAFRLTQDSERLAKWLGPRKVSFSHIMKGLENYEPGSVLGWTDYQEALITEKGKEIFKELARKANWDGFSIHKVETEPLAPGLRSLDGRFKETARRAFFRELESYSQDKRQKLVEILKEARLNEKYNSLSFSSPLRVLTTAQVDKPVSFDQLRDTTVRMFIASDTPLASGTAFGNALSDIALYRHIYSRLNNVFWTYSNSKNRIPQIMEAMSDSAYVILFDTSAKSLELVGKVPIYGRSDYVLAELLKVNMGDIDPDFVKRYFLSCFKEIPHYIASSIVNNALISYISIHQPNHSRIFTTPDQNIHLLSNVVTQDVLRPAVSMLEMKGVKVSTAPLIAFTNMVHDAFVLSKMKVINLDEIVSSNCILKEQKSKNELSF